MNNYPIDPTIISILFNIRSEEASINAFKEFEQLMDDEFDNAVLEYLTNKSIAKERIQQYFESADKSAFEDVNSLLTQPEMMEYTNNKMQSFGKKIYDEQMPNMSDEQKTALVEYLKELNTERNSIFDRLSQGLGNSQ